MMQSCASRRSSGAAGPFFRTAWKTMGVRRGTATSDRHRQSLAQGCQMVVLLSVSFRAVAHDSGRQTCLITRISFGVTARLSALGPT
jgi:hypothetical protein